MELAEKHIVITGAGNGIGRALAERFAVEGPSRLTLVDVEADAVESVAEEVGGTAIVADLSSESGNTDMIRTAEDRGPIDLLFCNAGIAIGGGVETSDAEWQRIWDVNVMAHVRAIRAALPAMLARGEGYICTTASAAGLLTNLGAAPYSVTKHAALSLAEWLAITHGDAGITVSCLCPQGVRTRMLFPEGVDGDEIGASAVRSQGVKEPAEVADAVVEGIRAEQFLILPHPEVLEYFQRKANDYERWLGGMRRLQARTLG